MYAHNILTDEVVEFDESNYEPRKITLTRNNYLMNYSDDNYSYQIFLYINTVIDKIGVVITYIQNNEVVKTKTIYINYDLYYFTMSDKTLYINLHTVGIGEVFVCGQ